MIEIHFDDDFVRDQYEYRKKELVQQLLEKLKAYNVDIKDIAA